MANETKKPEPTKQEAEALSSSDERVMQLIAKSMATVMPSMAAEIAKAMGTAMVAADSAKMQMANDANTKAIKAKLALEEKCHICRQPVGDGKRRGCGGPFKRDPKTNAFVLEPVTNPDGTEVTDADGKPVMRRIEDPAQFHVKREVWPKDPIAAEWFDGVTLNGARYASMGPGHEIWVPKNSDVDSVLSAFTKNEVEQRVGRKHVRSNGGRVSQQGGYQGPGVGVGFG